jgi:hypothetical protein
MIVCRLIFLHLSVARCVLFKLEKILQSREDSNSHCLLDEKLENMNLAFALMEEAGVPRPLNRSVSTYHTACLMEEAGCPGPSTGQLVHTVQLALMGEVGLPRPLNRSVSTYHIACLMEEAGLPRPLCRSVSTYHTACLMEEAGLPRPLNRSVSTYRTACSHGESRAAQASQQVSWYIPYSLFSWGKWGCPGPSAQSHNKSV